MEKCVLELAIPVEDGVMSAQTNTEISNLMCHVCEIRQESKKKLQSHIDNQLQIVDCRTNGKIFSPPKSREHGESCPFKEVMMKRGPNDKIGSFFLGYSIVLNIKLLALLT